MATRLLGSSCIAAAQNHVSMRNKHLARRSLLIWHVGAVGRVSGFGRYKYDYVVKALNPLYPSPSWPRPSLCLRHIVYRDKTAN